MDFDDKVNGFAGVKSSMVMKQYHQTVNDGDDEQLIISGYKTSSFKTVCYWFGVVVSCAIFYFISVLKPKIKVVSKKSPCPLSEADTILVTDSYEDASIERVVQDKSIKFFIHKKIKYVLNQETGFFEAIKGLSLSTKEGLYFLKKENEGMTNGEATRGLSFYGINSISIEIKAIYRIVLDEISSPFYMYQMFIIVIWLLQFYYQFAICIFLFSVGSVTLHVIESRKQSILLREKIHSESQVLVMREGIVLQMSSKHLVPGDVLILPAGGHGITLECDAILLTGRCTVDESMLTGECVPVSKNPVDRFFLQESETSSSEVSADLKKCTLFCGTKILSCQLNVEKKKDHSNDEPIEVYLKALVVRTGYSTSKGELVRSILFPKKVNLKLMRDYIKCMLLFFVLGIPCMTYTFVVFYGLNAAMVDIILTVVDVATFLCPPLLPAVMTSINAQAQRRLRSKNIYCLNPSFINFSGGLDVIVFDKTGTLTEDSLDFQGCLPVSVLEDKDAVFSTEDVCKSEDVVFREDILQVLGCCHSLVQIEGKAEGEDLELKMFQDIGWEFKKDSNDNQPNGTLFSTGPVSQDKILHVVRVLPFESHLQRMLVIVFDPQNESWTVLMKGAPEVVSEMCDKRTIPADFGQRLEKLTQQGFRVLAAASRTLNLDEKNVQHISRQELEQSFSLTGLLVFQNMLKPQTTPTMLDLRHKSNIRTVMATGDNIQTAAYIARQCGLIGYQDNLLHVKASVENEGLVLDKVLIRGRRLDTELEIDDEDNYAVMIEGPSYKIIRDNDPIIFERIVNKGGIFARMTPDQKLSLVSELQRQGHVVGMCGDGANDCGALRAANTGISLSVAESSVASPFTYTEKTIECFPKLMLEGKATLFASFASFKYQTVYCFCLLSAVMILMMDGQKPSDFGYVFVDIILNILPPLVFGAVKPSTVLTVDRPQRSLFAFIPLFSIFSFTAIETVFYLIGRSFVMKQDFYEDFKFNATTIHDPEASHMQVAMISLNTMTYVIAAIIFSTGSPFRQTILSSSEYLNVFHDDTNIFFWFRQRSS